MPISKSQSGNLFFRYRSQKSVLQSAAYVFRRFLKTDPTRKKIQFSRIKDKKKCFSIFAGKKVTCQVFDTVPSDSSIELSAFNYSAYPAKNLELASFKYPNQYYYLNLNVVNRFCQTSCRTLYNKIPVASKYLFFIKIWLNKLIMGLNVNRDPSIKVKPILDAFKGFTIDYIVFNVIFGELQSFIKKNLPVKYAISYKELDYIRFKTGKRPINCVDLKVFCVRYVSDIIVLSKCLKKHVKDIQR